MKGGKRTLRWAAAGTLTVLGLVTALYFFDMQRAYERVRGRSAVLPSPYGDIEYAQGGDGSPVLVVHGSGGGYDQGELLAEAVLGEGFRWIAPSRFGYLRSTFKKGATFDEQADAYAFLLDRLGLDKVHVVALSHGGPSALLLAARHPERVTSLTLISCGVASEETEDQAQANQKGDMLTAVFKHDPLYWSLSTFLRGRLTDLMGADKSVVADLGPRQRDLLERVIDYMNPAKPRSAGVLFDNGAAMPNEKIAAIQAPTLIFHAKDDGLQLYRNAEYAASHIARSRLVSFERGGHLLLGVEQETIRELTRELAHADLGHH